MNDTAAVIHAELELARAEIRTLRNHELTQAWHLDRLEKIEKAARNLMADVRRTSDHTEWFNSIGELSSSLDEIDALGVVGEKP